MLPTTMYIDYKEVIPYTGNYELIAAKELESSKRQKKLRVLNKLEMQVFVS